MSTSIILSSPANSAGFTDNDITLSALFDVIYEDDLSTGSLNNTRYKTLLGLILGGSVQSESKLNVTWGVNVSSHPGNTAAMDTVFTNATGKVNTTIDTVIGWGINASNLKPSYLPSDAYVFKAEGYLFCPIDGNYTFAIDSDDCGDLAIDGTVRVSRYNTGGMGVSNNWNSQVTISMTAGWHTIRARMEEGSGGDGLGVAWKMPGDTDFSLIQPSYFSTALPSYASSGTRVSVIALSGITDNMIIDWSATLAATGSISVSAAISTDGINPPQDANFIVMTKGGLVVSNGTVLEEKYLWIKIILSSTDSSMTPVVTNLKVNIPNPAIGSITFEIDRTTKFNSPSYQTTSYTSISRKVVTGWLLPNMKGGDWYWRASASSQSKNSGYSEARLLNINAEVYKRVLYQVENVGKQGPYWNKKRVLYQFENVSKYGPDWLRKRGFYQYENITSDPPFPYIEKLSSTRGPAGSVLTITGNGFGYTFLSDAENSNRYLRGYGGFVYIGSMLCSIISWSWTSITVQLPAGAVSGPIKVQLTVPNTRDSNVVGFEIYEGIPADDIGIELFVCDKVNPNTILCQLDGASNKAFQMIQNSAGSGSFTISRYDPKGGNKAYIAEQNFILCKLDGNPLFKWIIESVNPSFVDSEEQQLISINGRGVLSMLNWAVVYPEDMANLILDREFTGTASKVLRTLIQEAKARGGLNGVSVDWEDDKDSVGNIFTENIKLTFHVGTPLMEVVTKFTDGLGYFDIEMTPNLELKIYKTKGLDLHDSVIYRPGQAIISHQNQSDATKIVNDVLVEGGDRKLAIASHSQSQANYGRREGYLSASNLESGLSEYGQAYLSRAAYPMWGIQGTIVKFEDEAGNKLKPFESYLIGDWIGWSIPPEGADKVGFDGVLRVKGITVNENDDTGAIEYVLELHNAILEHEIKLNQKVERMSQYSGGNDVLSVAPSSSNGYSVSEVNEMLAGKANTNHEHVFTDLIDAPNSYEGQSGKVVTVKADATGLEFKAVSSTGVTPNGDGTEDTYTGTLAQAGSTYNPMFNFIEILQSFWVEKIKLYCANGGLTTINLRSAGGELLATGSFTPSSTGWYTATLDIPIYLKAGGYYCVEYKMATAVKPYRTTSYLYSGTLWKMQCDKVSNFFTGTLYSETPGLGLIEYKST